MKDRQEPLPPYPAEDDRNFGYHAARTAVDAVTSFVPGGSYVAGKVIERFIAEPLAKRRDAWFERLGEGVRLLEDRIGDFDPESLDENEDFVSAVFEATQAAMKTTKDEKLEALRNGVLNIAAGLRIEDILRGTFFGLIERYSPAHFHILNLLADPSKSAEMVQAASRSTMGSQMHIFRAAVPETVMSDAVVQRIFADLNRDGLADTGAMSAMGTSGVFLAKRTSEVGDAFIRFIADPA